MTTNELQDILRHLLDTLIEAREDGDADDGLGELAEQTADLDSVRTYDEVAMLTRDAGLVVRTTNGDEFQVTIVRSR